MLPLFWVLLSFGSFCSSAPTTTTHLRELIKETLQHVYKIEESEFQALLETPNIMENGCILKNLNTFIESVNSSNFSKKKELLVNLQSIQTHVEMLKPNLKEPHTTCELGKEDFEAFKNKFKFILWSINEKFGSLY